MIIATHKILQIQPTILQIGVDRNIVAPHNGNPSKHVAKQRKTPARRQFVSNRSLKIRQPIEVGACVSRSLLVVEMHWMDVCGVSKPWTG